ncbi:hypothetical protein [Pedobacter punctiformis]|uniref:EF-hand domain-containing protein n=1 Tax=Pedobacter punctiformis TaxID=3004097 RepID=A0ABT4L4F2_9SPHI|nr:hypothetical protein [Pedobacter sp. HCMS5-2]MCZ4242797.1 hypothetical protein [Pedobacter sp. HCMS5-2]
MENLHYQPSGIMPGKGIVLSLVIAFVSTVILSIAYIALQWFIPIIYLNVFITLGLGFGIFMALNFALGIGKIRNTRYAFILSVVCALLAFYSQWALFVSLMYEASGSMGGGTWVKSSFNLDGFWYIFTHPKLLFDSMVSLNEVGTFTIKKSTVSGGFLWVVWVIEALMILGIPVISSLAGKATKPFSELNNAWMEEKELETKLSFIEDKDGFIQKLTNGNFEALKPAPADADLSSSYAQMVVFESPGDGVKYLTVRNVVHNVDKKGNDKVDKTDIVEYFRITSALPV